MTTERDRDLSLRILAGGIVSHDDEASVVSICHAYASVAGRQRRTALSFHIYIYVCMYVCMYVSMYVCILVISHQKILLYMYTLTYCGDHDEDDEGVEDREHGDGQGLQDTMSVYMYIKTASLLYYKRDSYIMRVIIYRYKYMCIYIPTRCPAAPASGGRGGSAGRPVRTGARSPVSLSLSLYLYLSISHTHSHTHSLSLLALSLSHARSLARSRSRSHSRMSRISRHAEHPPCPSPTLSRSLSLSLSCSPFHRPSLPRSLAPSLPRSLAPSLLAPSLPRSLSLARSLPLSCA
jgi:hypothetical protein